VREEQVDQVQQVQVKTAMILFSWIIRLTVVAAVAMQIRTRQPIQVMLVDLEVVAQEVIAYRVLVDLESRAKDIAAVMVPQVH